MTQGEKIEAVAGNLLNLALSADLEIYNTEAISQIETLITEGKQQQTFRVVQSLVKANAISDTIASQTLALFQASLKGKEV